MQGFSISFWKGQCLPSAETEHPTEGEGDSYVASQAAHTSTHETVTKNNSLWQLEWKGDL